MTIKIENTKTGKKYYLDNIRESCAKKYIYYGKKNISDTNNNITYT